MVRQMYGAQQLPRPQVEPCLPQQMRVLGLVVVMAQSLFVAQHWVAAVHVEPVIVHIAAPPPAPPPLEPPPALPPAAFPPAAPPALPPAEAPPAAPPALDPPAEPPPAAKPPPEPDDVDAHAWA